MADKISDADLKSLIDNPNSFLGNPVNRARVLGVHEAELKAQLKSFAARNNLQAASLVKEIIKSLITQTLE